MTKATITKQTPAEVSLHIIVTKDELQSAKAAVLDAARKDVKVSGFRPGQAPDAMVERSLDPAKLQVDVVEKVLAATFTEAVSGHKIRTLAHPKVDVKKFVPFDELEYDATVAVLPEITYDYTKLKVKYTEPKIDKAEIEIALENVRQQAAGRTVVERAVQEGDEVRLDFDGEMDGKPVDGAKGMNTMIVIGSNQFIPGFEDQLVGLKAKDKKTFTITFPKDYHATELAGQDVEFSVQVHEVREIKLPDLDDKLAKEIANFPTLDDLRDDIRKHLMEGKETEVKREYESAVLAEAVKNTKLEISPILESEQLEELQAEVDKQVRSQGLEMKDWLKIQKKTEADFTAELKAEAQKRIQIGLIIRDVIDKQKIVTQPEEVEIQIENMRTTYSDPEVLEHLDHDHFKQDVANRLITQRAVDWLCEQAK